MSLGQDIGNVAVFGQFGEKMLTAIFARFLVPRYENLEAAITWKCQKSSQEQWQWKSMHSSKLQLSKFQKIFWIKQKCDFLWCFW